MGLLSYSEWIARRHARETGSPDRALRSRILRVRFSAPRVLSGRSGEHGRKSRRRRYRRRRHGPSPIHVSPDLATLRHLGKRHLYLLLINTSRRRRTRHVRLPRHQDGAVENRQSWCLSVAGRLPLVVRFLAVGRWPLAFPPFKSRKTWRIRANYFFSTFSFSSDSGSTFFSSPLGFLGASVRVQGA
jgi:hypothetical protein